MMRSGKLIPGLQIPQHQSVISILDGNSPSLTPGRSLAVSPFTFKDNSSLTATVAGVTASLPKLSAVSLCTSESKKSPPKKPHIRLARIRIVSGPKGTRRQDTPSPQAPFQTCMVDGRVHAHEQLHLRCGLPIVPATSVDGFHQPIMQSKFIDGRGRLATFYSYAPGKDANFYEFIELPRRHARAGEEEPIGSDPGGVRRFIAATRLNAELGTNFLPEVIYCLDPKGRFGIGIKTMNSLRHEQVQNLITDRYDRRDVENCACFFALLGYPEPLKIIRLETSPGNHEILRDAHRRLRIYSDQAYAAFRYSMNNFQTEPVVDSAGRGNGFTLATISPRFRLKLRDFTEARLRGALGDLINESWIQLTLLALQDLQAGIRKLEAKPAESLQPDQKGNAGNKHHPGHSAQASCLIL